MHAVVVRTRGLPQPGEHVLQSSSGLPPVRPLRWMWTGAHRRDMELELLRQHAHRVASALAGEAAGSATHGRDAVRLAARRWQLDAWVRARDLQPSFPEGGSATSNSTS